MDVLDDMGVSKLSANVFLKVNNSLNSWWELHSSRWTCCTIIIALPFETSIYYYHYSVVRPFLWSIYLEILWWRPGPPAS